MTKNKKKNRQPVLKKRKKGKRRKENPLDLTRKATWNKKYRKETKSIKSVRYEKKGSRGRTKETREKE